jgi:electron transfer flavoprotein alpha subunit
MSILIYTESENGNLKNSAFELASYGRALANKAHTNLNAIAINSNNESDLSKYGVDQTFKLVNDAFDEFNANKYAHAIAEAAKECNANIIILSSSANSKYLAPLLAVKMEATYASNVVELPSEIEPLRVKRTAFSNKAFSLQELTSSIKIISLAKNTYGIHENESSNTILDFKIGDLRDNVEVTSVDKSSDKVSIADAEIVISGGRGLKGPENWNLIEDLAEVLGAATACSKPVSDLGWRPHSEHVGQTGKPVASNLYIAIGISGAIQHLAGVNSSKVKVVINTDPEAPFFKAADYGIVGDAFEVVPELIEKLKVFKTENA